MTQTKVEAPFVENNRPLRNIMINGDMAVSQRGDSTGVTSSGYHACDRWNQNMSDAGTLSISQDTEVPAGQGFSKSLKLDCTTADASIASGSYHRLQQRIEAQNMAAVESGSANAKQTVWSFWIKFDNASGDFCVNVLNLSDSNNRVIAKKFTYASGAGWQKYSFVIPGDTGGNALTPDNSGAYYMQLYLQAGSDLTSGTLQTTWGTRDNTNRAVGQTLQLTANTSNNVYLTGCQWEIGDAPSDFEHTPFDVQLQRCRRYLQRVEASGTNYGNFGVGANANTASSIGHQMLSPNMRSVPTLITTGTAANYSIFNGSTGLDACAQVPAINGGGGTSSQVRLEFIAASGTLTAGQATEMLGSDGVSAFLMFDAEL